MSLYLIAVLPPKEIDTEVRKWKEYMFQQFNCRVALRSPAHITLIPPFTLADDKRPVLENLLDNFVAREREFPVELNNFSSFPPRVIFVYVSENPVLSAIKTKLEDFLITENYPVKKEQRPFHPHVTIETGI
jgi:2'-5' RNA ligase